MIVDKMAKERVKQFLKEYYRICKKYGVIVNACGCCDSPYLTDLGDPKFYLNESWFLEMIQEHIEHLLREADEVKFSEEEIKTFIKELEG